MATQLGDDGSVAEQSAFDPYGKPQAGGSSVTDPKAKGSTLGFQGAITDRVTGSVVLGPRLYDPSTARFSSADSFVAGGLDLGLALDPLTGNRYLFARANPVAFYDDGHEPELRLQRVSRRYPQAPAPGTPRLSRVKPLAPSGDPVSVDRRSPTSDRGCPIVGRRSNGRCNGATFIDYPNASDSGKEALDPNYESGFLNAERAAAENIRKYGPNCAKGAAQGGVVGARGGVAGVLTGAGVGCSQEVSVEYLRPRNERAADALNIIFNGTDIWKVYKSWREWIRIRDLTKLGSA